MRAPSRTRARQPEVSSGGDERGASRDGARARELGRARGAGRSARTGHIGPLEHEVDAVSFGSLVSTSEQMFWCGTRTRSDSTSELMRLIASAPRSAQ